MRLQILKSSYKPIHEFQNSPGALTPFTYQFKTPYAKRDWGGNVLQTACTQVPQSDLLCPARGVRAAKYSLFYGSLLCVLYCVF